MIDPVGLQLKIAAEDSARRRAAFQADIERVIGTIDIPFVVDDLPNGKLAWQWTAEYRFTWASLRIAKLIDDEWIEFPNLSDGGFVLYVSGLFGPSSVGQAFAWFEDYESSDFWRRRTLRARGILQDTKRKRKVIIQEQVCPAPLSSQFERFAAALQTLFSRKRC